MALLSASAIVLFVVGLPTLYLVSRRSRWPWLEKLLTCRTGELEFSWDVSSLEERIQQLSAKKLHGEPARFVIAAPPGLFGVARLHGARFVATLRESGPGQSRLCYSVVLSPIVLGVLPVFILVFGAAFVEHGPWGTVLALLGAFVSYGIVFLLHRGVLRLYSSEIVTRLSEALAQEMPTETGWSVGRKVLFAIGFGYGAWAFIFASADDVLSLERHHYAIMLGSGAALMAGAAAVRRYGPFGRWSMRAGCLGSVVGLASIASRNHQSWGLLGWITFGVTIAVAGGLAAHLCRLAERRPSISRV